MVCRNSRSSGKISAACCHERLCWWKHVPWDSRILHRESCQKLFLHAIRAMARWSGEASRCSYLRELRWPSLAWLEGISFLPSTMERIAKMSPSNMVLVRLRMRDYMEWRRCFKIQTFWMQSICSSEKGKETQERERKTYNSSSGGNPPWIRIRLQYECVQVLYSLVWKMHCIKSNPIRRGVQELEGSRTKIIISKFYLWTSCLQRGLISRQKSIWINMRKYMLEMDNITF